MKMMQGDSYNLPIELTVGDPAKLVTPDMLDDLEVVIGNVRKTLGKGDITYDAERSLFLVYLSQQDTFRLCGNESVKIRPKFIRGDVIGINAGALTVEHGASKVVL